MIRRAVNTTVSSLITLIARLALARMQRLAELHS